MKVFIGVIGSGKDYQCKLLTEKGYIQVNFADALREMAWRILGLNLDIMSNNKIYEEFKKMPIKNYLIEANDVYNVFKTLVCLRLYKIAFKLLFTKYTGRQFLQDLGMAMRKRDKDYWIKKWQHKVDHVIMEGKKVCCSDCRFPNEVKAAIDYNADFIFCNYKSDRYEPDNEHESEELAQYMLIEEFDDLHKLSKYEMEVFLDFWYGEQ